MAVKNLDKTNFGTIKNGVIDFYASWCGPCKMMAPVFDDASSESDLEFGKVNVEEQPDLANEFGVRSIPTFVVIKDGKESGRFYGYMPKEAFLEKLKSN